MYHSINTRALLLLLLCLILRMMEAPVVHQPVLLCKGSNVDVLDWNGDGGINIADPTAMLNKLFISVNAPDHDLGTDCIRRVGCPDVCMP